MKHHENLIREKAFLRGLTLFKDKRLPEALDEFRNAIANEDLTDVKDIDPLYLSYYGLLLGIVRLKYDTALRLCKLAEVNGYDHPEIFINLGKVYELNKDRQNALEAYRAGYRRHPKNKELFKLLQVINPRGKVFFPFLNRDHPLNRIIGILVRRRFNRRAHSKI